MRPGVAVLLCLAACSSGQGVALQVTSDPALAIEHVELFVAESPCGDTDPGTGEWIPCEGGVGFAPAAARPPGNTFLMVDDEDVITTDIVDDHGAFVLNLRAAAGGFADPSVIAIVGFDASDEPRAVAVLSYQHIPINSREIWNVELVAADPAQPSFYGAPSGGEQNTRVHTWKREGVDPAASKSRCLAIQSWNPDTKIWDGTFVVPDTDRDCDGEAIECDPRWANLNQELPQRAPAPCLTRYAQTDPICIVGGNSCRDGFSDDRTCSSTNLPTAKVECVPDALCDACPDPFGLGACLVSSLPKLAQLSQIICPFTGDSMGVACGDNQPGNFDRIHLPFSCNGTPPDVRLVSAPFTQTGSQTAMVANDQSTFTVDLAFGVNQPAGECILDVGWKPGSSLPKGYRGYILLAFPSKAGGKETLIPMRIELTDYLADCNQTTDQPVDCIVTNELYADPFTQCAL